jgi:hypothetical protein
VENTAIYCFLPYLKTSASCRVRGVDFRNANDTAGLEPNEVKDINALSRMFYVPQGGRIAEPTYAVLRRDAHTSLEQALQTFREAQLLIGYLYGAPKSPPSYQDDTFLRAECWSAYTFAPDDMIPAALATMTRDHDDGRLVTDPEAPPTAEGFSQGYVGFRDGLVPLWVVNESQIYPEVPNVCLNISQELNSDVSRFCQSVTNWPLAELLRGTSLSADNSKRVFTSLLWHSRSCRTTADPVEKLISLAIALETLLALAKGERLTSRFKEAVTTLIGPVPRLDDWLEQFYDARSGVVHEGEPDSLFFRIPGPSKSFLPHRNLIVYGRRIFRICLNAALSGMLLAKRTGLPTLLIHNDERLSEICIRLTSTDEPERRLKSVERLIEELHECETLTLGVKLEESLEKLVGAMKLMVQTYEENSLPTVTDLDKNLQTIKDSNDRNPDDLIKGAEAARKATELLRKFVRQDRMGRQEDEIMLRFLEFASRPAVAVQCHRRKRASALPENKS